VAFGALARVVLGTAKVSEADGGGRIMVRAKSNLGPDGGGFRYDLRLVQLEGKYSGIEATCPEWIEALQGEARELLAAAEVQGDPEERGASDEAKELLREMLASGRIETKEARRKLKADGFTDKQIRRAREALSVVRSRDGFGGKDYWSLPPSRSCPVPVVPAHTNSVGTNGHERETEGTNDADLMALVERIAAHFSVAPGELEAMKETARGNPAEAWRTFSATAEAEGIA
jgi:vacuolar-type H+-ATPase subunit H